MSHTENTPLLEVRNLKKYFGKKDRVLHAVDDISVTIQQGKTLGVVGESGCGKSTLGRTVLRLLEPTDGQIIFDGQDITHVSEREMRKYRQSMQIIFQDPYSSLNPRKSVAEIIATPLKVNHICKDRASLQKRVRELMDTVGLAERLYDAYPHELDGGRRSLPTGPTASGLPAPKRVSFSFFPPNLIFLRRVLRGVQVYSPAQQHAT